MASSTRSLVGSGVGLRADHIRSSVPRSPHLAAAPPRVPPLLTTSRLPKGWTGMRCRASSGRSSHNWRPANTSSAPRMSSSPDRSAPATRTSRSRSASSPPAAATRSPSRLGCAATSNGPCASTTRSAPTPAAAPPGSVIGQAKAGPAGGSSQHHCLSGGPSPFVTSGVAAGRPAANSSRKAAFTSSGAPTM